MLPPWSGSAVAVPETSKREESFATEREDDRDPDDEVVDSSTGNLAE